MKKIELNIKSCMDCPYGNIDVVGETVEFRCYNCEPSSFDIGGIGLFISTYKAKDYYDPRTEGIAHFRKIGILTKRCKLDDIVEK